MHTSKKCSTYILFLTVWLGVWFCQTPVVAQQWDWVLSWPGAGSESLNAFCVNDDGSLLISGAFDDALTLGSTFESLGEEDVFLARLDPQGSPLWAIQGGSVDADQSASLLTDALGNIYWLGSFFGSLSLEGSVLEAPGGGKALFLVKIAPTGEVLWSSVIDGTGSVVASTLLADATGHFYVTGDFTDSLFLADTALVAGSGRDFFLARFDSSGVFDWASHWGDSGSIHARTAGLLPDGSIVVGGFMNGLLQVGNDLIQSETDDEDGWVARISPFGEGLWVRKVGAQYDDRVNGLSVSEESDIFLTGTFLGVLEVGPITITTQGFNHNFFLARLDKHGNPMWARSLGTDQQEEGLLLAYREGPVVAGWFRATLTLDGLTISGVPGAFNGFVAAFDDSGLAQWIAALPTAGLALIEAMQVTAQGALLVGGSFSQEAYFDEITLVANGPFELFLAELDPEATAVQEVAENTGKSGVYPNPTSGPLQIFSDVPFERWQVYDAEGTAVQAGQASVSPDLSALPDGSYFLQLQPSEPFRQWIPPIRIVKVR